MAERIEYPSRPAGTAEEQLKTLYDYLYRMADTLNLNLTDGGQAFLTESEQQLMNQLTVQGTSSQTEEPQPFNYQEQQTLKSLIIKTAEFVKTAVDQYKMILYGETEAQSDAGIYRRKTGLRIDMTPEGEKRTYSFAEVVQGLKTFEINAKNYIKTGLLRTESSIPIYGVAIGKDVVTFSEDGKETYHDGNKVAELTADELSFYQSGKKLASYKGSEIIFYINNTAKLKINGDGITFLNGTTKLAEMLSTALKFYYNGTLRSMMDTNGVSFWNGNTKMAEMKGTELIFYQSGNIAMKLTGTRVGFYNSGTEYMYIENGKIYTAGDMQIGSGKNISVGDWRFNSNGLTYYSGSTPLLQLGKASQKLSDVKAGVFVDKNGKEDPAILLHVHESGYRGDLRLEVCGGNGVCLHPTTDSQISLGSENQGKFIYIWITNIFASYGQIDTVSYVSLVQRSSREIKHDIEDMPEMGDRLDQLRPVTFVYDNDPDEKKRFGLIYEETEEVMPEICSGDEGNKTLNYVEMVPMLLKEIQSLRARVSELEGRN